MLKIKYTYVRKMEIIEKIINKYKNKEIERGKYIIKIQIDHQNMKLINQILNSN
jgi:hypothetical protein